MAHEDFHIPLGQYPIPGGFNDPWQSSEAVQVTPAFFQQVGYELAGRAVDDPNKLPVLAWALGQGATTSLREAVNDFWHTYAQSGGARLHDPVAPAIQFIRGGRSEVQDVFPTSGVEAKPERLKQLAGQLALLRCLYAMGMQGSRPEVS